MHFSVGLLPSDVSYHNMKLFSFILGLFPFAAWLSSVSFLSYFLFALEQRCV